jgi:hypothetical protein
LKQTALNAVERVVRGRVEANERTGDASRRVRRRVRGSRRRTPFGCQPRPCVRTMCTLVHTDEARVVAITRRSGTARCAARDRADERLFLCARSSTSRQLREAGSPHGRRGRSRAHRPSRRRSRGASCSRLRRRSLFSPRPGSAPRVRTAVRRARGALGSASRPSRPRQPASHAARLPASAMCTHHVYTRTRSTAYAP